MKTRLIAAGFWILFSGLIFVWGCGTCQPKKSPCVIDQLAVKRWHREMAAGELSCDDYIWLMEGAMENCR